jgi:hypothetical protein
MWFVLIFTYQSLAQFTHGTCIVITARDTVVYMGADSRSIVEHGNMDKHCKIAACGNKIIGTIGAGQTSPNGFAPRKEILKVIKQFPNDTILQSIMRLDSSCRALIHWAISKGVSVEDARIEFMGCEYINGKFKFTDVCYFYNTDGVQPKVQLIMPHYTEDFRNQTSCGGNNKSIIALKKLNPNLFNDAQPIELIKRLIKSEANRVPRLVGGYIDIVQLTRHGVSWVRHKKQCKLCK